METKICTSCNRELPANKDYYFMKLGKLNNRCKECCGSHFTDNLSKPEPKNGYIFCKKCNRELPHTYQFFPEDKSLKSGIRFVCRECNKKYGRFLNDDEDYHFRFWTEEEDKILIENYNKYTGLELVAKFFPNRTIRSLESRASNLGIAWKDEDTKNRAYKHQSEIVSELFKGRDLGQEWKDKISVAKKKYYETHDSWWLGKKRSEEQCKMISERMKGKWAGNKNPRHINPLTGENNGRWNGGIMETYRELRSDTKDWFNESIAFCNYKCVITNGEFDNVHHTTAFRDIVDQTFKLTNIEVRKNVNDYTEEEFNCLRSTLKDLHIMYGFGACICKDVHKLFHDNYGYTKITPYDFLDFIYRIDIGEFDEWFKQNDLSIDLNYEYVEYLEGVLNDLIRCA